MRALELRISRRRLRMVEKSGDFSRASEVMAFWAWTQARALSPVMSSSQRKGSLGEVAGAGEAVAGIGVSAAWSGREMSARRERVMRMRGMRVSFFVFGRIREGDETRNMKRETGGNKGLGYRVQGLRECYGLAENDKFLGSREKVLGSFFGEKTAFLVAPVEGPQVGGGVFEGIYEGP